MEDLRARSAQGPTDVLRNTRWARPMLPLLQNPRGGHLARHFRPRVMGSRESGREERCGNNGRAEGSGRGLMSQRDRSEQEEREDAGAA